MGKIKKVISSKPTKMIIIIIFASYLLRFCFYNYVIPWSSSYVSENQFDWVLKPEYTYIYEFKNDMAYIEKDGTGKFFRMDGSILDVDRNQHEEYLRNTLYPTSNNAANKFERLYGLNNLYGEIIAEPKYKTMQGITNEIIVVRESSKPAYEFLDENGEIVTRLKYEEENEYGYNYEYEYQYEYQYDYQNEYVYEYSEGLLLFKKDGLYGYMDRYGEIVIRPQFEGARPFSEGYAAVAVNDPADGEDQYKWGFIDKNGDLVIDYKYLDVGDFGEGLVAYALDTFEVKVSGASTGFIKKLYGYMNINEDVIIEPRFFSARNFSDGVAIVIPLYMTAPMSTNMDNPEYHVNIINRNNEVLLTVERPVDIKLEDARSGYIKIQNLLTEKYGLIQNPGYTTPKV